MAIGAFLWSIEGAVSGRIGAVDGVEGATSVGADDRGLSRADTAPCASPLRAEPLVFFTAGVITEGEAPRTPCDLEAVGLGCIAGKVGASYWLLRGARLHSYTVISLSHAIATATEELGGGARYDGRAV